MTEQVTEGAAEVIRDLAHAQTEPSQLEPGGIYAWLTAGQVHKVDLTGDQYRDYPQRKKGAVTVRNVASFAEYYGKHADIDSEVYADVDAATFTAVLDAHKTDGARWQQHRLVLKLEPTLPWTTWLARDRRMQGQQEFAEFVEDNARDVAPGGRVTAADLLEVSQSFQAHTSVKFQQGTRLATGQTQLTYIEDVEAKAGRRGEIVIPSEFDLAIVPYEDCAPAIVAARFRYRLASGDLRLGYFLNDPARTARAACDEVAAKLAEATGATVMQGRPD